MWDSHRLILDGLIVCSIILLHCYWSLLSKTCACSRRMLFSPFPFVTWCVHCDLVWSPDARLNSGRFSSEILCYCGCYDRIRWIFWYLFLRLSLCRIFLICMVWIEWFHIFWCLFLISKCESSPVFCWKVVVVLFWLQMVCCLSCRLQCRLRKLLLPFCRHCLGCRSGEARWCICWTEWRNLLYPVSYFLYFICSGSAVVSVCVKLFVV